MGQLDKIVMGLGIAFGILNDPIYVAKQRGQGLDGMINFMGERLKNYDPYKIPDAIKWSLTKPSVYQKGYIGSISLGIGGWALKQFGSQIHPWLGKVGKLLYKLAIGLGIGTFTGALLFLPGYAEVGSNPGHSSNPGSGNPTNARSYYG